MALLAPSTGTTHRARVAGAASPWVVAMLAGPRRSAPVVHVGRDAAYVDVAGAALGILSRHATHVPCGIRTGLPALAGPHGIGGARVGDVAEVGDGVLLLNDVEARVSLTVASQVSPVRSPASLVRVLTRSPGPEVVRRELPAAALDRLGSADPACVRELLGRGTGLTPVGDDVLAGWLATTVATGRSAESVRGEVDRLAATSTTTLSATLLGCAGRGDVVPEFRRLLATAAVADAVPALAALLRVGHTSGAGLALGCLLALAPDEGGPA